MVEESGYALCQGIGNIMNTSTSLARTMVRQILEAGVTDVVISPGSRNAPLSIAFYEAAARKLITLHTRIDERTAAFFALGIAKASQRPVPIVCTSGTAVANYHPAVLEASHSNTPLLVITADRPAELRRTGANQTTLQAGIYGKAVRYFADISGAAYPMVLPFNSLKSGPVHLNVQFEEPLVADDTSDWLAGLEVNVPADFNRRSAGTLKSKSTRGVLVVGHDRGGLSVSTVTDFAEKLGWPLIAEDPLSFPSALPHASIYLTSKTITDELAPDSVVVIGRTTLSRSINRLIANARKVIVVDPRMLTVDSDRIADQKFTAIPEVEVPPVDREYAERWRKFSERTAAKVQALAEWSEPWVAREIASHLQPHTALFISSSRPIRDLEGFASTRGDLETFANRGLAGIDGNISTALGIASQRKSTVAILGDLSFLHDLTGLIHHEDINLRMVVIDNNGGGIFSTLPQRGVAGFEEIFGTPHNLDLQKVAQGFGIETSLVTQRSELIDALSSPVEGISIVIVKVPDRESNADLLESIYAGIDSI